MLRMAGNEQHPSLLPTLYRGVSATVPRSIGTLHAMWSVFLTLAHNKIPAINGELYFSWPPSLTDGWSSAPSTSRLASIGRGQGRTPSQSPSWQARSRNNPFAMNVKKSIPDCFDPWLDTSFN